MRIYDNIRAIAKEKKVPIYKIESINGLAKGSINKWNVVSPTAVSLKKVADFLGVSMETLLKE